MHLQLSPFADIELTEERLHGLLDAHVRSTLPRLERLWDYYRNPVCGAPAGGAGAWGAAGDSRRTRLAQERGLPARLVSPGAALGDDRAPMAREIVIENDIAWRVHAMVDFMAGRAPKIACDAPDSARRERFERVLEAVLEASGGAGFVQDVALLGAVYGSVAVVVRGGALFDGARRGEPGDDESRALEMVRAGALRLEVVEAPRAIAVVDPADARRLDALIIRVERAEKEGERAAQGPGALRRLLSRLRAERAGSGAGAGAAPATVEIVSARWRQTYVDGRLADEGPNHLGALPAVFIQNASQPLRVEGLSEVEPLIPLQDELNTRLSDRANRVTLQSFRMYLAKGVESLEGAALAVAPGRVIATDNVHASIEAFGGDAPAPGEDRHIEEVRAALDKASGVTPLAAGVIETKLGNLSSENALRVTLLGLIAKTQRKQAAYGRALAGAMSLALRALHEAGVMRAEEHERSVRLRWPEIVPRDERAAVETARMKLEIGVSRETVLQELGYAGAGSG